MSGFWYVQPAHMGTMSYGRRLPGRYCCPFYESWETQSHPHYAWSIALLWSFHLYFIHKCCRSWCRPKDNEQKKLLAGRRAWIPYVLNFVKEACFFRACSCLRRQEKGTQALDDVCEAFANTICMCSVTDPQIGTDQAKYELGRVSYTATTTLGHEKSALALSRF